MVDEVTDPDVARTKLAWWRQEITAAYSGTAQHPVALTEGCLNCIESD